MRRLSLIVAAAAMFSSAVQAAETQQLFGFKPDTFEIKYFVQPRFAFDPDTDAAVDNSFSIRRARLNLTSTVAPKIKGKLEIETRPQGIELREVWFEYAETTEGLPGFAGRIGQFKKPFGYQEYEMSSSNLNLIDRPAVDEFLENTLHASSYDQGAMVIADLWEVEAPLVIAAGAFNGNGLNRKADDNSGKEFVARADATPVTGVSVGGNIALNGVGTADSSEYVTVWGGDFRIEKSGVQFVGEIFGGDNYARRLTSNSAAIPSFLGWYGEAIYRSHGWEPAARVEHLDPDTDSEDDAELILTGQIGRTFSQNFRWQINVVHSKPQEDGADSETQVISQWTVRL